MPLNRPPLTGGVVYNLALKDVIANFDDVEDAASLQETARALLTQGEVMQLAATDELVMISGLEQRGDPEQLLEYGADDFISKPITPLELVARVRAAVEEVAGAGA